MKRFTHLSPLFILFFLAPALAVEVGPICQWYQDPCRTMAIHWVADRAVNDQAIQRWRNGPAGFGYGHDERTKLSDMKGNYDSLYLRRVITIPEDTSANGRLVLALQYSDGFVAFLDGKEVASKGTAAQEADADSKESSGWEYFDLGPARAGSSHLVAIVGINSNVGSADFQLNPRLEIQDGDERVPLIAEGDSWSYLTGDAADPRWKDAPPIAGLLQKPTRYQLVYRPVEGGEWKSAKVTRRPFAKTDYDVFTVDLTGLTPGTRYVFQRLSWGKLIDNWFFETAPDRFVDGVNFVTGGDMYHTRELLDAMNRRAGTEAPLFALLGGDLAYANGVDTNRWLEWIESWTECAISPDSRLIPMVVVIGNHEVRNAQYRPAGAPPRSDAPYFYSLFLGLSEGSKFAVDFSDYMSVVAVDSGHTANVKAQNDWLRRTLQARKDYPRLFVCYHRPAWGTGVKGNAVEIQRAWSPIFEEHLVDAVFENDHHVYKRTHPIVEGKRDDERGIVYMGDGSWGVSTRSIASNWRKAYPYLAHAESTNHLIKVTLRPDHFHYQAITADGKVIDDSRRPLRR